MKKNGFTLIEVLAVIIIIGIIMIITIPAVSKYIIKSNNSVYAQDTFAYVENVRSKYEMGEYGEYLKDYELMIVPIRSVVLEKGNEEESPFGAYDFERSYVIIVPENSQYKFYVTIIDNTNTGIINVPSNLIDEDAVMENIKTDIPKVSTFEVTGTIYKLNGREYKKVETRVIQGEDVYSEDSAKAFLFKDITVEQDDYTKIVYKVDLNNHGATRPGTATIYELYTVGWYSDSDAYIKIQAITPPTKDGYEFKGYYKYENGGEPQIINASGYINVGTASSYTNHGEMHAYWVECPDGYYSHDSLKCTICPEGYRDGTSVENKTAESKCLKNVSAGNYVANQKDKNVTSCAVNKYSRDHTVEYGKTSSCPLCTQLGAIYTQSPGGTGPAGCYATLSEGKYVANAGDGTATNCPANQYSVGHTVNYGSTSMCSLCINLGSNYTKSAGGTGPTGCYMEVANGKYKKTANGNTTEDCAANKYKNAHKSYYGSSDSCTNCTNLGSNYTHSAVGSKDTGCYMDVSGGKRKSSAKGNDRTNCAANTYSGNHTSYYGSSDSCTNCTKLGSNYTHSAAGSVATGCYMDVAAGKYKTSSTGNSTQKCGANTYSGNHTSYYNSSDSCTPCPSGYTCGEGATGKSACKITCPANTRVASVDSTCSACPAGKTKASHEVSAGSTSSACDNCSNSANVATWGSGCTISTCNSGYSLVNNTCQALSPKVTMWKYETGVSGSVCGVGGATQVSSIAYTCNGTWCYNQGLANCRLYAFWIEPPAGQSFSSITISFSGTYPDYHVAWTNTYDGAPSGLPTFQGKTYFPGPGDCAGNDTNCENGGGTNNNFFSWGGNTYMFRFRPSADEYYKGTSHSLKGTITVGYSGGGSAESNFSYYVSE